MKTFQEYMRDTYRTFIYKIKIADIEIDEKKFDIIRSLLDRFDILDMSEPKLLPIQQFPLDFYNIKNVGVTLIMVKTQIPMSFYNVQRELKTALNIPETYIVVREVTHPLELETDRINAYAEYHEEGKQTSFLETPDNSTLNSEIHNVSANKLYGDEYNSSLLNFMANLSKLGKPDLYDTDTKQDYADFNKNMSGIKPIPSWKAKNITDQNDPNKYKTRFDSLEDTVNNYMFPYKK